MARVVIEGLSKVFKGARGEKVRAVDNAGLTVEDKELVVLVGPSGCGKTTTLRLIAGLEEPDQGTISIDGQIVNDLAPKERDIAMVFQNYALYPHMSVYENMAFGLKLRGCPRGETERRVTEAAEMLDLTECLERKPQELSGGQRQRVALGRAIVRRPKVFLLDEPLANLDAQLRAQLRAEVARLHNRLGATMIYVTHDQVEAMTLGQRIAVMRAGTIQQIGAPMRIYAHPANLFVAGFIGWPPMNFFRGRLVGEGNEFSFQAEGGEAWSKLETSDLKPRLEGYEGKTIVLGLRPESIKPLNSEGRGKARPERIVEAVAEVVEPMGPETYLHLSGGGHRFVARANPGERVSVGERVSLLFDMRSAHFFDAATEQAIG